MWMHLYDSEKYMKVKNALKSGAQVLWLWYIVSLFELFYFRFIREGNNIGKSSRIYFELTIFFFHLFIDILLSILAKKNAFLYPFFYSHCYLPVYKNTKNRENMHIQALDSSSITFSRFTFLSINAACSPQSSYFCHFHLLNYLELV